MPQALEQGNISRKPSGQRPMMRQTHKHMLCEFKSAEHTHQNSIKRNKQKRRLSECFCSCPRRFNCTFFFFMHTKHICSKFTADERCQIDSPRDWDSLYRQIKHRVRKFVTLPKCLIIHSLRNHLHTTKPFTSPWKMSKNNA